MLFIYTVFLMKNSFIFFVLLFLPACGSTKKNCDDAGGLINLVDSTNIIRSLLIQNRIGELLEQHDPEQLDLLLNNFSPAQMAFESEVLSTTVPLVIVYYFKNNAQEQEFIKQLDYLAKEYDDSVKFVIVDADALFSLARNADIENYPTLLFVKDRTIIDRIEQDNNVTLLKQKLSLYA